MFNQQFPGQSFDDQTHPSNSTGNLFLHMESNGRSETSLSQQFSEMNLCPAVSEERFAFRPDDSFDGTDPNPWAVKQFDRDTDVYEVNNTFEAPPRVGRGRPQGR